jgi:hypothetical protein
MTLQEISAETVTSTLLKNLSTFERKRMRDFEYLNTEIDPPLWVLVTVVVLLLIAYAAFWVIAYLEGRRGAKLDSVLFGPIGKLTYRRVK